MAPNPEPLSPDDAAILALENEAIAGHTLKVAVLEPGKPLELERLRARIGERARSEPRALQRVELPDGAADAACWVEDQGFDVRAHVRRRPDSAGIDERELWRIAGEVMSERLDHERPLWALDLVGPLADGREAIVARLHHAMVDGVSALRFLAALLWDPAPADEAPAAAAAAAAGRGRLAEAIALPGALRRELGGRGSSSPLDRPVGAERELAFALAGLDELKRIGHSRPRRATVNDVLVAGVAGGLREWLPRAGAGLPRLRAQIPVSLHHRGEGLDRLGNRDSFLNLDLPLDEPDPGARIDRVSARTTTAKQHGDAQELYDFFHALARFKHLGHAVERFAAGPREFSLSISNVPGPRAPVGVCGRRVERLCSAAEPAARHALRVSALSCAGEVGIGLCTDPRALADVAGLADAIEASFAQMRAATVG